MIWCGIHMYESKSKGNGRLSRCHVLFGKASSASVKKYYSLWNSNSLTFNFQNLTFKCSINTLMSPETKFCLQFRKSNLAKCHILMNGISLCLLKNIPKNKEKLSTFNEEVQVTKLQDLCLQSCSLTIWSTSKSIFWF